LRLQAGLGVSTKALPHGGEHFLGEGVLFARAETGISLKNGLCNSVPAACAIPRSCHVEASQNRFLRLTVEQEPERCFEAAPRRVLTRRQPLAHLSRHRDVVTSLALSLGDDHIQDEGIACHLRVFALGGVTL